MFEKKFYSVLLSILGIFGILSFSVLFEVNWTQIGQNVDRRPQKKQPSLTKDPKVLSQVFKKGFEVEQEKWFSSYFAREVYFSFLGEHNWFSNKQTIALLNRSFQKIEVLSIELKQLENQYGIFQLHYNLHGTQVESQLFLCYQKENASLKINRIEENRVKKN